MQLMALPVWSERGEVMKSYLPRLYENSRVVHDLMHAEGVEFDALREAHLEILRQALARLATWSLDEWESQLGLPPNPALTTQERQDRVVSRLRGYGTCTAAVVKQVAASYQHGTIDVVEDHAAYTVYILFTDTTGVPSNMADLQAALRAVIPAHLEIVYLFNWFTWAELNAENWTWAALDALNLTWAQLEAYK